MLVISNPQSKQFEYIDYLLFVDKMKSHIETHFPQHFEQFDDETLTAVIEEGVKRAKHHSFESERDVCKYINLMLTFGVEFDSDPKQMWAQDILNDPYEIYPPQKMDRLYAQAEEYINKAAENES